MLDAFRVQDLGEPIRFMPGVIPFAGADNDAHVIVLPRVGRVRQIIVGAVEINVVVVVAVEKRADVERPAEGDEVTDRVGMAKRDIGGVIGAKARTAHRHPPVEHSRRARSKTSCVMTRS